MRPIVVVLGATALIAASSQPIRADPVVVDQVSALSATPADAPAASSAQSPSMLVGISGQLVALEVFLSNWATAGPTEGRATGNIVASGDATSTLASHTISPFATPPGLGYAPVYFDLASAQLQVISGRLLAFVEGNPGLARADRPSPDSQTGSPSLLPPAALAGPGSGTGSGVGTVVFAQPAPVPEPTTIALVGSGLLLGAMGRRRQRKEAEKNKK
jgi:hypothetical protein